VPPVQHSQTLCSISFATDKKRPSRVDNEAKACLDEVALDLGKAAGCPGCGGGHSDAGRRPTSARQQKRRCGTSTSRSRSTAAERAVNAKQYLVTEKGIDAARVSVATSAAK